MTFQYGTLGLNIIDMGILCPPTEWVRVRAKFLAASRGVRPPVLVGFLLANQKLGALARAESGDSGSCPWAAGSTGGLLMGEIHFAPRFPSDFVHPQWDVSPKTTLAASQNGFRTPLGWYRKIKRTPTCHLRGSEFRFWGGRLR